ncbi:hypothetical protein MAR_015764 [Mya arenaria]|uniref:Uncharacterized protein n=1 Tax=Mya arenaria TaxID=6604 RepID=A0ABY7FHY5_MYAAR|nr:hypothetical protein MAR_015764 [Mya arenaria]
MDQYESVYEGVSLDTKKLNSVKAISHSSDALMSLCKDVKVSIRCTTYTIRTWKSSSNSFDIEKYYNYNDKNDDDKLWVLAPN